MPAFHSRTFLAVTAGLLTLWTSGYAQPAEAGNSSTTALSSLARGHEEIATSMGSEAAVSVVLQRGDKQFVVGGVTALRAVGGNVEITVNNGRKYSVAATDIFFVTNDTFNLK